ncbi:24027_t:CDS:2, partial [Gigaspora margarita]
LLSGKTPIDVNANTELYLQMSFQKLQDLLSFPESKGSGS